MTHPSVAINPFTCPMQAMRSKPPIDRELRDAGAIVEVLAPGGGRAWVVTEDTLGRRILGDSKFVKDPRLAPESWRGMDDNLDLPPAPLLEFTIISVDGDPHKRLRRVHAGGFSAARLKSEENNVRAIAVALLERLDSEERRTGEPTELASEFAFSFPLLVICHLLGVPVQDPRTARVAIASMKAMSLGTDENLDHHDANSELEDSSSLFALIQTAIDEAKAGADTMTGVLLSKGNEEFGSISDEQLTHMIIGLIFAGHDTTGAFLSFLLAEYLHHRNELRLGTTAEYSTYIDENLRFHPPVPYTLWRFASEDVVVDGVHLPRGSGVLVAIQAINSDPRLHENPDELRHDRAPGPKMTFGAGAHYCPGEQLALLEARTMLRVFDENYPKLEIVGGFSDVQWSRTGSETARVNAMPAYLSREQP